jgi:hypothetical protein
MSFFSRWFFNHLIHPAVTIMPVVSPQAKKRFSYIRA